jgi:hypothetical protein
VDRDVASSRKPRESGAAPLSFLGLRLHWGQRPGIAIVTSASAREAATGAEVPMRTRLGRSRDGVNGRPVHVRFQPTERLGPSDRGSEVHGSQTPKSETLGWKRLADSLLYYLNTGARKG